MEITDNLFLTISNILGAIIPIRVTPDNLRVKMNALAGSGGITNKVKTEMLIEIMLAFAELEKKIDSKKK